VHSKIGGLKYKELVDFGTGGDLAEAPAFIKEGSRHQEIQHPAFDLCYGDGEIYNRNEIKIGGGFGGSDEGDIGVVELQCVLRHNMG